MTMNRVRISLAFVILLSLIGIGVGTAWISKHSWVLQPARTSEAQTLRDTIIAIYAYYDVRGQFPPRVERMPRTGCTSWRILCADFFEAKSKFSADQAHPYVSYPSGDVKVVAIDYEGSPWQSFDPKLRYEPNIPLVLYSTNLAINWTDCGDLVYFDSSRASGENTIDIQLTKLYASDVELTVGFTNGEVRRLTVEQLMAAIAANSRGGKLGIRGSADTAGRE